MLHRWFTKFYFVDVCSFCPVDLTVTFLKAHVLHNTHILLYFCIVENWDEDLAKNGIFCELHNVQMSYAEMVWIQYRKWFKIYLDFFGELRMV